MSFAVPEDKSRRAEGQVTGVASTPGNSGPCRIGSAPMRPQGWKEDVDGDRHEDSWRSPALQFSEERNMNADRNCLEVQSHCKSVNL